MNNDGQTCGGADPQPTAKMVIEELRSELQEKTELLEAVTAQNTELTDKVSNLEKDNERLASENQKLGDLCEENNAEILSLKQRVGELSAGGNLHTASEFQLLTEELKHLKERAAEDRVNMLGVLNALNDPSRSKAEKDEMIQRGIAELGKE